MLLMCLMLPLVTFWSTCDMVWIYGFTIITTLFAGWRVWRRLRYFLHIFQLEGYKPPGFRKWLRQRAGSVLFRLSHTLGISALLLAVVGYSFWSPFWTTALVLPTWTVAFASSRLYRSAKQKKPLAYTARLKRLLATTTMLALLPLAIGIVWGFQRGDLTGYLGFLGGFFLADLWCPLWVLLAAWLMKPVEKNIQNGFKRQARTHLKRRPDLHSIAITGSYGKTSVKFIIAEILKQRYNTLATPGSYNTPMGICIVVNNKLKAEHQMLVLEMGIRHPGDMHELCEIAQPDTAVVTSIGVAHLETMGSKENIAQEKGTMLDYIKTGGIAVLNADDPFVLGMRDRAPGKVWLVSVEGHPEADIVASGIQYGRSGASFFVRDDTGHEQRFQTKLLGKHNVLNILLGIAVGRSQGMRLRQIAHAVKRIEPVEHRLQLRQQGAITVIDDAFNSNPVGSKNAVEILGQFTDGKRVIVTPGMIELGERQYEENRLFGKHIAQHVDLAVLIGDTQTKPIQDGLAAQSFPPQQTKVFNSLFDAQDFLKSYLSAGDVVLYENDLPDQFNEG